MKFYEKIPSDFLEKFENLTNTATVIWREAKLANSYKRFEPSLSKIFDMNRQMAEYLGYKDSPYDALMDLFEEGLVVSVVEPFFSEVKIPLQELLGKITHSQKYFEVHPLENAKYDKAKMAEVNNKILKLLWGDSGRLRLDVSAHPFTTSFSNNDTRITTWYHDCDFARSVLATVHEFGHALYDLQCDPNLQMTPIQGGSSLVIHESQSRLWENFVGRSEPFINHFKKDFEEAVGRALSTDDLLLYFNKVSPGPLRVEADEVTYHFHIMLRFEIEKAIIEGRAKSSEVRELWNSKMKEYLGITPKSDSEGVLQDVHWSGGMVGYFPTYSLGTFLGAQFEQEIENCKLSLPSDGKLKTKNYEAIEDWLRQHVHKYGSTYTLQDLLKKNGMKFNPDSIGVDPQVNLKYLQEKYGKIYGF